MDDRSRPAPTRTIRGQSYTYRGAYREDEAMRIKTILIASALVALLASGCGGDDGATNAAGGDADVTDEGGADEGGAETEGHAGNGTGDVGVAGAVGIEAGDLYFDPETLTAEAGDLTVTLTNVGAIEHDFVIEEIGDEEVVHTEAGETATGIVTLEPGTYTFYCSIPGHRPSMEGTLEVG